MSYSNPTGIRPGNWRFTPNFRFRQSIERARMRRRGCLTFYLPCATARRF